MPDPDSQASGATVGAGAAVADNPSPETGTVQGSNGASQGAEGQPQDHRQANLVDLNSFSLDELLVHPRYKGELARRFKSEHDKGYHLGQKAMEDQRRREDEENALLTKDPYEVGEAVQDRLRKRRELQPLLDQVRKEGRQEGYQEGYSQATVVSYADMGKALEVLPYWKAMSEEERQAVIQRHPGQFADFFSAVISDGFERHKKDLNAQMKKLDERTEREAIAEERLKEETPSLGRGTPAPSGLLTQAEFDANRKDAEWCRRNSKRISEAFNQRAITR